MQESRFDGMQRDIRVKFDVDGTITRRMIHLLQVQYMLKEEYAFDVGEYEHERR